MVADVVSVPVIASVVAVVVKDGCVAGAFIEVLVVVVLIVDDVGVMVEVVSDTATPGKIKKCI